MWKDATSYSRDELLGSRIPRSWELRLTPDTRITVVSEHIYHKGEWIVHCHPWFNETPLGMPVANFSAEQAQEKALSMVRAEVAKLSAALDAKK